MSADSKIRCGSLTCLGIPKLREMAPKTRWSPTSSSFSCRGTHDLSSDVRPGSMRGFTPPKVMQSLWWRYLAMTEIRVISTILREYLAEIARRAQMEFFRATEPPSPFKRFDGIFSIGRGLNETIRQCPCWLASSSATKLFRIGELTNNGRHLWPESLVLKRNNFLLTSYKRNNPPLNENASDQFHSFRSGKARYRFALHSGICCLVEPGVHSDRPLPESSGPLSSSPILAFRG